jgi:uncharacterized delta-60 repeat protein
MSFSISNTSASAVITTLSTPSSVTGELTITSGSLPLVEGDLISGTNTEITNTKGSQYGTIQMFLQQGDVNIDTYVNNTLYSTDTYGSGMISVQTPILQSGDSLTMSVSDSQFDCYSIGEWGGDIPESIAQQSDGKMIYVGYYTSYAGVAANRIIRLNTDFSIDDTFVYGTGFNAEAMAVAIQPDGKILVGGNFTQYNGTARNRIVRLNTDGSLDTTFGIGTGFNANVFSIVVQPDNKILVGGDFTQYSGSSRSKLVRLTSTGAIDTTFANPSTINNTVYSIALQTDNKVVIGGIFSTVSGVTCGGIARLTSTGIIDNTFQLSGFTTGGGGQGLYGVSIDPSGKIMCGGTFTTYSGASVGGDIARLNTDGTYDSTFAVGSGITGSTRFVVDIIPTNGKYFVTGVFDNFNGSSVGSIMRLNDDGSLDTTFNTGTGTGYDTNAFGAPGYIQSDGNYNFASVFSDYDGTPTTNMIVVDPMGKLLNCEI